jgi:hypothetical protein
MKRTTFSHHLDAFSGEAMALLRFQLAFDRMSAFNDLNQMNRMDFMDRIISLKAIENDILIRVCKFDDDTKGVHSFKKAILEIPKTHKNKIKIESEVKNFSKLIDKIKKHRRHTQLAHLKIGSKDDQYEPSYKLKPAIKAIVDIINLMEGVEINYKWSDGRYEKYDLVQEVFKDSKE